MYVIGFEDWAIIWIILPNIWFLYLIIFMFWNRPSRKEVKKGQTIRLNCKATGFPKPHYAWYKDGGRLSSFHDRFRVIYILHIISDTY